jgi:hypothetical protein
MGPLPGLLGLAVENSWFSYWLQAAKNLQYVICNPV